MDLSEFRFSLKATFIFAFANKDKYALMCQQPTCITGQSLTDVWLLDSHNVWHTLDFDTKIDMLE